jgi:hypothetical protein
VVAGAETFGFQNIFVICESLHVNNYWKFGDGQINVICQCKLSIRFVLPALVFPWIPDLCFICSYVFGFQDLSPW